MAIRIAFASASLASHCTMTAALDQRWGNYADNIRVALSVLAACDDLTVFEQLPNVTKEGEFILFKSGQVDVVFSMINSTGPVDVVIADLTVRSRGVRS